MPRRSFATCTAVIPAKRTVANHHSPNVTVSNHEYNEGTGSVNTSLISGLVHSLGVAEEWPVEGAKTKIILTALVISVIVVASIGFYLIKDAGVEGITAIEGFLIADQIAHNWSQNATINYCRNAEYGESGSYLAWRYHFIELPPVRIEYSNITDHGDTYNFTHKFYNNMDVTVFSNGTSIAHYSEEPSSGGGEAPIENWTIDSDSAYQIASDNSEISQFLRHNPSVYIFSLHGPVENGNDVPTWFIEWTYDAGFDDPHWATIHIDATTGEILDVEADN